MPPKFLLYIYIYICQVFFADFIKIFFVRLQSRLLRFILRAMNQYQQEFIQNLKELRCQKQFSQAKLSELCNVATGTIGNIECGISKPSFDLILNMARVLDVHPATLFSKHSSLASADSENKKMLQLIKQQIEVFLEKSE